MGWNTKSAFLSLIVGNKIFSPELIQETAKLENTAREKITWHSLDSQELVKAPLLPVTHEEIIRHFLDLQGALKRYFNGDEWKELEQLGKTTSEIDRIKELALSKIEGAIPEKPFDYA